MLKRNTQRRRLAENTRWDASDSWGDLHRTGDSRLSDDQEVSSVLAYASLLSVLADSPIIRLSIHRAKWMFRDSEMAPNAKSFSPQIQGNPPICPPIFRPA